MTQSVYLWSKFEEADIIELLQSRQTSSNRTDKETMCDDIPRALSSLIENDKVQFVSHDWKMISKCHPEGLDEFSLGKKLARLDGKLLWTLLAISNTMLCTTARRLLH